MQIGKDGNGMTAVDIARQWGHHDIAEFISNYKPVPKGELEYDSLSVSVERRIQTLSLREIWINSEVIV